MKPIIKLTFVLLICLSLLIAAFGCKASNKSGNTYNEPEITVEYLTTDYADQLMRDGAVHIFGSIEIFADENGNPFLNITEKEYVTDETQPNGFYIADKNLESTYPLSYEARTTHLTGDTSIPVILTSESFVKAIATDIKLYGSSAPEYAQDRLYDIYVIGEQVEMVLARYIP